MIIDGGATEEGLAKFINHSCDPNCRVSVRRVRDRTRILIVAIRDIGPGEEITFYYNVQPNISEEMENESLGGDDTMKLCYCGTTKCRWNEQGP